MRNFNKVCERFRTDQSLFNQHFRGGYLRLPYSYNAQPTVRLTPLLLSVVLK